MRIFKKPIATFLAIVIFLAGLAFPAKAEYEPFTPGTVTTQTSCDQYRRWVYHDIPGYFKAAKYGQIPVLMKFLLEHKYDCCEYKNSTDSNGNTALMYAVRCSQPAVVQLLLEDSDICENINKQNNNGETACTIAIRYGNGIVIDSLLKKGADPNIKNCLGHIALLDLVKSKSLCCVSPLVSYFINNPKATNDIPESEWQQALICAIRNGCDYNVDCLAYLLSKQYERGLNFLVNVERDETINMQIYGENKISPLMYAVALGNDKAVELLLKYDADPYFSNENKVNALMYAALGSSFECLREILYCDSAIKCSCDCLCGAFGINRFFESSRIFPNEARGDRLIHCRTKWGGTALIYAVCNGDKPGFVREILRIAKLDGVLRTLIDAELFKDAHFRTGNGVTALCMASRCNYTESVKELLSYGADPNIETKDEDGVSYVPLHYAVKNGNVEMVRAFLRDGRTHDGLRRAALELAENLKTSAFNPEKSTDLYCRYQEICRILEGSFHGVSPEPISPSNPTMQVLRFIAGF